MSAYGWRGTIAQFLGLGLAVWLDALHSAYRRLYRQAPAASQRQAWRDSGELLNEQLACLIEQRPQSAGWWLIFEYELPHEGGRRPDLIVLGAGHIVVIEFKQKTTPTRADLDQTLAYARDLGAYHSASHQHLLHALLVATRRTREGWRKTGVAVLARCEIAAFLRDLPARAPDLDADAWVEADYRPSPSLVRAAQQVFQNQPLPVVQCARSAGVADLLGYLERLADQARACHERHLVLVSGAPGTGKTLVGLQFVYGQPIADGKQASFLSGNAALVEVLQYALGSRVFVQGIRNFYLHYEVRRQRAPGEHIIVFDEAQRAWDARRMNEKYGIAGNAPGTVLRIAERISDWCVVLALIGAGQEIHVGEEEGLLQWRQAVAQGEAHWQVHGPPALADSVQNASTTHERFDLSRSLRTRHTVNAQQWVERLLAGDLAAAAELPLDGFDVYLTRDLEAAKTYCRERYQAQAQARYGLLASSRARNLPAHGVANDYPSTQRVAIGPWYVDPPQSPLSCCALTQVVTEFGSQGLELEFPIVAWGDDLLWQDGWVSKVRQRNVWNPLRLRVNSYRVLLTRGRDGMLIFVPPEAPMDATCEALLFAGCLSLPKPPSVSYHFVNASERNRS